MKLLTLSLLFLGTLGLTAIWIASTYVSSYNLGNRYENRIVASHDNLKNILSQYQIKISEMAQVPDMYKDDMKEVISAAIQGRYGEGGSKAVFQWLKEQNPSLDVSVYSKIQIAIEGGRDRFTNEQTIFIDTKRAYETELGSLITGTFLRFAGYPKINLSDYNIVTNVATEKAFETGVDEPVKLR